MTLYLDTSLLVCALAREKATPQAQTWLSEREVGDCAISDWVVTEFSSALSIKVRTGQLPLEARGVALAMFARLALESMQVFAVTQRHFRTAAGFADLVELGIRGADALHLAICVDQGATLCTMDRRLAAAAPAVGVVAQLV